MRRAISISNTRKITASRKKRREKGRRAEFFGSNPHSNGLDFSRSASVRRDRAQAIINTSRGIASETATVKTYNDMSPEVIRLLLPSA